MSRPVPHARPLAALLLLASVALAQSGGSYDLSWWTVDGGGATFNTGGGYSLGGTAGQPDAAPRLHARPPDLEPDGQFRP